MSGAIHRFKPTMMCTVEGCTQERRDSAKLCHTHYMRMRRTGSVERPPVSSVKLEGLAPLGRNIVALRFQHAMSAAALARHTKLSAHSIWRICRGDSTRLDTIFTIASVFNVEAWELLKPGHFPVPDEMRERA